jgi:hypothetical protein
MDDEEGLEKELLWGRKRDRRVEVLRVCLGKREEEFWGEKGALIKCWGGGE